MCDRPRVRVGRLRAKRKKRAAKPEYLWLREVRVLRDDDRQTPILTNRTDLDAVEVAYRIFHRWRQENFFKYMAEEFALDALVEYGAEEVSQGNDRPNPQWTRMTKRLKQAKAKVETVLQGLRKGTSFEELASRYSDDTTSAPSGGDIGFFKKGEMIPMLEAVVFMMKEGDVSEVIQSSQGFHILKVTDRRAGSIAPFEEIKAQVTEDYYREEVMRLYTKWLDDLKNRSNVEVKL